MFHSRYAFTNPTTPHVNRILLVGDSITRGLGSAMLGDPNGDGYRLPLHLDLVGTSTPHLLVGTQVCEVGTMITLYPPNHYHEGRGSHTVQDMSALIDNILAAMRPDVVHVHLGTVNCANGDPFAETIEALSTLVDQVTAGGRRAVVCQIIPQGPPSGGDNLLVQAYNAAIPLMVAGKVDEGKRVVTVDMFTDFDIGWCADGVHPQGDDAHSFMGTRAAAGVRAVLAMP